MRQITAKAEDAGRRLDVVVAQLYPRLTRSSLEPLFDRGLVTVDNRLAKASHKLREGEKIKVDDSYINQKAPKIDLPIIYEDENVVVIDKPGGVLAHAKGALNLEPTVASFIAPKLERGMPKSNRAGIVHRLDRWTSGIMITAKTAKAMQYLQKQFSQRKVKKTYLAIVDGVPEPAEAIIDAPIARNPKRPQTFAVMPGGKPAQTRYKVLNVVEEAGKTYAELELSPKTGRTHQLRVHLAYISHPVAGDPIYGRGGSRLKLHAAALELTLPGAKRQVFKSKLPSGFRKLSEK